MSNFTINTDFQVGDEIKIVFDIFNEIPTTAGKTVYIVDLQEMQPNHPSSEYDAVQWSNVTNQLAGANSSNGAENTSTIISQTGHTTSAAKLCADLSRTVDGVTYDDWYLPTAHELSTLFQLISTLDPVITNAGGDKLSKAGTEKYYQWNYWGSNESQSTSTNYNVFVVSFHPTNSYPGAWFGRQKTFRARTRAVRKQTTNANVAVGDLFGGGVIFKIVNSSTSITPEVDLDITIGNNNENIFSQDDKGDGYSNSGIETTITSQNGSSPEIDFTFTNSNTGNYGWGTNVQIFKKIEEVTEEIQPGRKDTLAWSDNSKRWTSRYSFTPEYFSTYQSCFASFVNGTLYIHDDSDNKNYFYNGKFSSKVTYIENKLPSQPKVFLTHSVEGNVKPSYTKFETIQNWTMASDLLSDDYERKEGTFYSEMYGDVNDPNVGDNATYGDKLMKGTKLRGQYLKVHMSFKDSELEVKHSNIGFITSKGHTT